MTMKAIGAHNISCCIAVMSDHIQYATGYHLGSIYIIGTLFFVNNCQTTDSLHIAHHEHSHLMVHITYHMDSIGYYRHLTVH